MTEKYVKNDWKCVIRMYLVPYHMCITITSYYNLLLFIIYNMSLPVTGHYDWNLGDYDWKIRIQINSKLLFGEHGQKFNCSPEPSENARSYSATSELAKASSLVPSSVLKTLASCSKDSHESHRIRFVIRRVCCEKRDKHVKGFVRRRIKRGCFCQLGRGWVGASIFWWLRRAVEFLAVFAEKQFWIDLDSNFSVIIP
jgi:hypothetical protein